jgi:two-component system chemotaxis sensor kinase CheA
MATDPEFILKLKEAFLQEAEEQIRVIASGLLEIEQNSLSEPSRPIVERIFREVHNLKGSARAADFPNVEKVCQSLESVFAGLKSGSLELTAAGLDVIHRAVTLTEKLSSTGDVRDSEASIGTIVGELESLMNGSKSNGDLSANGNGSLSDPDGGSPRRNGVEVSQPDRPMLSNTIKIPLDRLDQLLAEAEELLAIKGMTRQFNDDMAAVSGLTEELLGAVNRILSATQTISDNASSSKATLTQPSPTNGQSSLDHNQSLKLAQLQQNALAKAHALKQKIVQFSKHANEQMRSNALCVDQFLYDAKKLMMIPCSSLLEMFPKTVRDLARDLGKEADFQMSGVEIHLDKRIISELKDPLLHLLRNAIDHGIEKPEERLRLGKPAKGSVSLHVSQLDASTVEILIADDGAGIDVQKVKAAAKKQGLVSSIDADTLTNEQIQQLIFASSLSTSSIISDISGRGLGLAIVKEVIMNLGGRVSVLSENANGTAFHIVVPVTIATFRGMFVECASQMFVIPTFNFERAIRVNVEDIKILENQETIEYNNKLVRLVELSSLLGIESPNRGHDGASINVAMLISNEEILPVVIDNIHDEQEVLIKRLPPPLVKVRNVAGATILGSGVAVPVLNVPDLFVTARESTGKGRLQQNRLDQPKVIKKLLVVDDTLTARLLLKNILESAGFFVQTANDGVEALAALRSGDFDIVITDVEMPRMTGFELTAQIRKDEKLAELPVVLVTALGGKADREKGVEYGANAYFAKSSFDQSNLLDVINKLV